MRPTRAPEQPPADSWAEETLLSECVFRPELLDALDVDSELQFREFRAIWRAMKQARRHEAPDGFYVAVVRALEQQECSGAHDPEWHSVIVAERERGLETDHPLSAWWGCRAHRLMALLTSGYPTELSDAVVGLALSRLHRATEARTLATLAQEVAERAWRGDVRGAQAAVARMPRREVIRVDV